MVDRDLITQAQKLAGGARIHSVSQIASGYLNQRNNADYYDAKGKHTPETDNIRNKAEYFERYLRSFLVTNDLRESWYLISEAMWNEGKYPWPWTPDYWRKGV